MAAKNLKDNNFIIELDKVTLEYTGADNKPLTILDNISAQVVQGQSLSIVGPSGAGKTSLMMLLAGVEKVTKGSIKIAGQDISNLNEDELALFRRKNIGVIFQNFHLIPTMSALENVSIALELAGYGDRSGQMALESLKSVGLEDRVNHYPEQLSGGEQQRVAVARAFAPQPKILLADEPTGNLDKENSDIIIKLLFDMNKKSGTNLVLITHDMDLADKTDRKFTIKNKFLKEA